MFLLLYIDGPFYNINILLNIMDLECSLRFSVLLPLILISEMSLISQITKPCHTGQFF